MINNEAATKATSRAIRMHLVRLLGEINTMIAQRGMSDEQATILNIAGPREAYLLHSLLEFLKNCDSLQDEDDAAFAVYEKARKLWIASELP